MRSPSSRKYCASPVSAADTSSRAAMCRLVAAGRCRRHHLTCTIVLAEKTMCIIVAEVGASSPTFARKREDGGVDLRLTILVGTMTGTSDLVAQEVSDALARSGVAAEVVA